MTRVNVTPQPPRTPVSVALGEMAIAAGIGGQSLTLCYRDYPAPLLCEQWKYLARSVDESAVYHVDGRADIPKIAKLIADLRLIFVHSPSHHHAAAWTVQMACENEEDPQPQPTILSHGTVDIDEDPGATLLLRCDAEERQAVTRWLLTGSRRPAGWANSRRRVPVEIDPAFLAGALTLEDAGGQASDGFREMEVLRRFLTGARLIRRPPDQDTDEGALRVTSSDYELVRSYLQSPIVGPIDDLCDPLAVEMVNRANVYLGVKYGDDSSERNPFYEPDPAYSRQVTGSKAPQPLITRREIADLGNTRSGMVGHFIEYLQQTDDGFDRYVRMGLVAGAPGRDDWQRQSGASLAARLRRWSVKQVRTHFERLHQLGVIAAERPQGNGAWFYALPEEFTAASNRYRQLPTAEELPNHIGNTG